MGNGNAVTCGGLCRSSISWGSRSSLSTPPGPLPKGTNYYFGPYLSPSYSLNYSVILRVSGGAACLVMAFLPSWPALIILPFPGLFRLTCYHYQGAYYKSFWDDPHSCAKGKPSELSSAGRVRITENGIIRFKERAVDE